MSHVALQRVMVRMLFDPEFASRVLADSRAALADVRLSDVERAWLARPDRRAWAIDPGRPARALGSLVQRYPASVAVLLRSGCGVERLLSFFRSELFHRSVQERGSMATAFGEHLVAAVHSEAAVDRRAEPLARLEQAMARLLGSAPGRRPRGARAAETLVLSPDKRLHRAPAGTADLHEAIHRVLAGCGQDLASALLDVSLALPAGAIDFEREEALLLELVRGDGRRVSHVVGASEITEELYRLLVAASVPRRRAELESETIALGGDAALARELIAGFVDDGTLVGVSES